MFHLFLPTLSDNLTIYSTEMDQVTTSNPVSPTPPLPENFITDLLPKLHHDLQTHLLIHLINLTNDEDDSNDNDLVHTPHASNRNDKYTLTRSDSRTLQHWIFSNITQVNPSYAPMGVVYLGAILNNYLSHLHTLQLHTSRPRVRRKTTLGSDGRKAIVTKSAPHFPPNSRLANTIDDLDLLPLKVNSMSDLTSLTFSTPRWNGVGLKKILLPQGVYEKLETLSLLSYSLDLDDLVFLTAAETCCSFPSLHTLVLSEWSSREGMSVLLAKFIQSLPKLKSFNFKRIRMPSTALIHNFARSPVITHLNSIILNNDNDLSAEAISALLQSSYFQENVLLKKLGLATIPLSQHHISLLSFSCPNLASLTHLCLSKCQLNDEMIDMIVKSPYLVQLEEFEFYDNELLSDKGVFSITQSPNFSHLQEIIFSTIREKLLDSEVDNVEDNGGITSKSWRYIGTSPYLTQLKKIDMSICRGRVDEDDFVAFISSPNLINLTHLTVSSSQLSVKLLNTMMQSPVLGNLTFLDIGWRGENSPNEGDEDDIDINNDGSKGEAKEWIKILASSPLFAKLRHLDLTGNFINDQDLYHLAQSPYMSNLTNLDLSFNQVGDSGIEYLSSSPYITKLERLDLYFNEHLTTQSFYHILNNAQSFTSRMISLDMRWCGVGNKDDVIDYEDALQRSGWFTGTFRSQ